MPYNLNQFQALRELKLESMQLQAPILEGIDTTVAYELGFATAIQHLENLISPDPMEVDVITVTIPEALPTTDEKKNSEDLNA